MPGERIDLPVSANATDISAEKEAESARYTSSMADERATPESTGAWPVATLIDFELAGDGAHTTGGLMSAATVLTPA